jgi:hypothetical protein
VEFGTAFYRRNTEKIVLKYKHVPNMEEMTVEERKFHKEGRFVCISHDTCWSCKITGSEMGRHALRVGKMRNTKRPLRNTPLGRLTPHERIKLKLVLRKRVMTC